ncbi:BadF/BadG/BcrA/BcrD ATPase family protein [Pelagibius sp. Alg239-R121]|uniref:BadF/BadG/BcrA/BcrD ATPase family protein n=1 Tax=Pelagibius sp. Alg239-R121 TaxID=2993448 RepID=UPI0024A61588|nr:BadF/BadG/BcrA/BcrD ATPase family protein [Pelagibius sp. Alg239-R121]
MYFLGVDGGGTQCRARIEASDGQVLGEGRSQMANVTAGIENSFRAIMASVDAAAQSAGLNQTVYADCYAGFGIAGANLKEHHSALAAMPFPFRKVSLESDAYVAWLGAHYPDDGAILIVGTGSAGFAKIGARKKTVGGWGFSVSDSGSGASMGRHLIRTALLCHEKIRPESLLTERVMARFGSDPQALVSWAETALPKDYAAFAPMVIGAAKEGDLVAEDVLATSLREVEELLVALSELGASRICLLGGLSDAYTPLLSEQVRSLIVAPRSDAMGGAITMARMAAQDQGAIGATGT